MSSADSAGTLTPPVGERDHSEGATSASVTLVEYGDYQCPYCGLAYPIVKKLQKAMGSDMRFVFRNFPLKEAHPHAMHAAIAAEAVGLHGDPAFWKMHDRIYEHQDALDDPELFRYAKGYDVPAAEVAAAFAGGPAADRVRADFRSGIRSGVNGTPTFFINGLRYDDSWTDVTTFLAALRAAAAVTA
jgi:protein-disulfide isomerase